MRQTRYALLVLPIVILIFLSGCVNIVQEIHVEQDGSGSLRFAIGVDTAVYPEFKNAIPDGYEMEDLLSSLVQDVNVIDVTLDHFESRGQTWDSIILTVRDFSAVFKEEQRIGPLRISFEQESDVFLFRQNVDFESANLRVPGVNLLDLSGADYTVRLVTPQIVDTNGVQMDAGTSIWEFPLADLVQGGDTFSQQAEFVLEPYEGVFIPWETFFPYVVLGFLGLGFISILVVIVVNTSRREERKKKVHF